MTTYFTVKIPTELSRKLDAIADSYGMDKKEITEHLIATYVADNIDRVYEMEGGDN